MKFLLLIWSVLNTHYLQALGIPSDGLGTTSSKNGNDEDAYDFIVVGSGSAGAVMASRLSEVPDWKVLLLEAGQKGNFITDVPFLLPVGALTDYNWNFFTEPQERMCMAMEGHKCFWPKGKGLGGSTLLNYMVYSLAHPKDHEKWNEVSPGWSYEEVLPFYRKLEGCNLGEMCDPKVHSTEGPMKVNWPFKSKLTDVFIEAGKEIGYNEVDYNSANFIGFSRCQANIHRGRRFSSSSAYLEPVSHRQNLKIVTSAIVTKVLIDRDTKEANGVEYFKNGKNYTARAIKEVILSAGTVNSPKLLMLSGVGPKEHLESLSIDVVKDSPVGIKIIDHAAYAGMMIRMNQSLEDRTLLLKPSTYTDFLLKGEGYLTSLSGLEGLAFIDTKNESTDYSDVELLLDGFGNLQYDFGLTLANQYMVRDDFYKEYYQPIEFANVFSIFPLIMHPKSFGYVKLRSASPFDLPLVYGNYFSDPENEDMKTMIRGIRFIQKLIKTKAFQSIRSEMYDKPIPGCEKFVFGSDQYWECAVRHITIAGHHQIASCRMGRTDDPEAVVDSVGRVYGIEKLRVVDTSIIPVTLSAHTSIPSVMMAEKISDAMKEEYNQLNSSLTYVKKENYHKSKQWRRQFSATKALVFEKSD